MKTGYGRNLSFSLTMAGKAPETAKAYERALRHLFDQLPAEWSQGALKRIVEQLPPSVRRQARAAYNALRGIQLAKGASDLPPWPHEKRKPNNLPRATRGPVTAPIEIARALHELTKGPAVRLAELPKLTRRCVAFTHQNAPIISVGPHTLSLTQANLLSLCEIAAWADGCSLRDWSVFAFENPQRPLMPLKPHSDAPMPLSSMHALIAVTKTALASETHQLRYAERNKRKRAELRERREKLEEAVKRATAELAAFDEIFARTLAEKDDAPSTLF